MGFEGRTAMRGERSQAKPNAAIGHLSRSLFSLDALIEQPRHSDCPQRRRSKGIGARFVVRRGMHVKECAVSLALANKHSLQPFILEVHLVAMVTPVLSLLTLALPFLAAAVPNNHVSRATADCEQRGYDKGKVMAYFYSTDSKHLSLSRCGAHCLTDSQCVTYAYGGDTCLHYRTSL